MRLYIAVAGWSRAVFSVFCEALPHRGRKRVAGSGTIKEKQSKLLPTASLAGRIAGMEKSSGLGNKKRGRL
ncbi:MAG: hypothetical protein ACYS71_08410 [Planctomycetota bacterium]